MTRILLIAVLCVLAHLSWSQGRLSGVVYDQEMNEPLIGAVLYLEGTDYHAVTGLDGSYVLAVVPSGDYTLMVKYIGYESIWEQVSFETNKILDLRMKSDNQLLSTVVITEHVDLSNDYNARKSEKNADNILNVVSAKTIEVSPDLTIANVVRRMSGVSLERSESGEAQYAILRGMDKRYNYTLVNGVKIPSPDNKNRYVSLDIFPSDLVDRIEVTKALTPDMEGDAIGGALNLQMKRAPNRFFASADLGIGYSEYFIQNDFTTFDHNAIDKQSYHQRFGEDAPPALLEDFTTENMDVTSQTARPNLRAAFSIGDRLRGGKLGWVLAGSYQENNRGVDRIEYQTGVARQFVNDGENLPSIGSIQNRHYSTQQMRIGLHNNLDFKINGNHEVSLYNMYVSLENIQARRVTDTTLLVDDGGRPDVDYDTRNRYTKQGIYSATLQGDHTFLSRKLTVDWAAVYSYAEQNRPDIAYSYLTSNWDAKAADGSDSLRWTFDLRQPRRWEYNEDQDLAFYLNIAFDFDLGDVQSQFKTGSMFRNKERENVFNEFTFGSTPQGVGTQYFDPETSKYTDIQWTIENGNGTLNRPENYQATEEIRAAYGQFKFNYSQFQLLGGVRLEDTDQGYITKTNSTNKLIDFQPSDSAGYQSYVDWLPSVHLKYEHKENINIRASYFKGISRPSFYEIIPYRISDENYDEIGNPELKRTVGHNYDLRFEYFPKALDQILVGIFYKRIIDPIEYAVIEDIDGTGLAQQPGNYGTASNFGIEMDYTRFIKKLGIKLNYTFTKSQITTSKIVYTDSLTSDQLVQLNELEIATGKGIGDQAVLNYDQSRPLQGQSSHVGNVSLLFKDNDLGFDAQLALVYTGERINAVSAFRNGDLWQKATTQLDFSAEQKIGKYFKIYVKINNILNTPYELYIKQALSPNNSREEYLLQTNTNEEVVVRRDIYDRTFLVGLKFKLNQ